LFLKKEKVLVLRPVAKWPPRCNQPTNRVHASNMAAKRVRVCRRHLVVFEKLEKKKRRFNENMSSCLLIINI